MKHSTLRRFIALFLLFAFVSGQPVFSAWAAADTVADAAASDQLDFANGLFARKMYAMAAAEYAKFIAAYPAHPAVPRAYFMIAEARFYLGEYRAAIAAYDDYTKRFPGGADAAHARLRVIASSIELKDCARALEEASSFAAESQPPDIRGEALYLIGLAKLSCGDKAAAVRDLQASCDIGAASTYAAVAAYQLGRIARDDKDLAGAAAWFDKAAALAADSEMKDVATIGAAEARLDLGNAAAAADLLRPLALGRSAPSETKDRAILGLIRALYDMKNYAGVIAAYKEARPDLRSSSLRMQAALFVAQAYTKEGKTTEAVDLLEIIRTDTALTPAEAETVIFAKVAAFIAAKRFDDAAKLLAAKEQYADAPRAAFLKAETSYYLKSYAEARKAYDAFLIAYPDSPLRAQALYGMAFAAADNKEGRVARDVFLKLVTDFPDNELAGKALYAAVVLDNDLGLKEDGVAHAKMYLERYGDREDARSARILLGRMYTDLKKPAEAIRVYDDYTKRYPADARIREVYFLMGRSYQASGDIKASTECFSRITKAAPGDEELYYAARQQIAQNYIAEKKDLEAAEIMEDVLANYTKGERAFDAFLWVAKRYIEAKRYDAALRVLSRAGERADAGAHALALAYYTAEAERGRGNYDAAMAGYGMCLKDDATSSSFAGAAYQGIGLCRMAKGESDLARQSFESAITANPADNTVVMRSRYYLADLLAQAGDLDGAAKMYMMVAILYDDTVFAPRALYKAIQAFDKLDREDETVKACRDFLKRFPKDENVEDVRKVLQKREPAG